MAGSLLRAMLFYVKLNVKDLKKGKLFLLDKIAEEKIYDTCSVKYEEFHNVTHKNNEMTKSIIIVKNRES